MHWTSSRIRASRNAVRAFLFVALAGAIALAATSSADALSRKRGTPPPSPCRVNASPSHAVRLINTPHAITVTVLRSSSRGRGKSRPKCNVPMAGATVSVRILTGPNAGTSAALTTGPDGKAVYNATSAQTGIEVAKFRSGGKQDVTRTFWVDEHGGPGPYGEKHKGVHFHSAGANSGAMYVPSRCVSRNFELHPAFYGGAFVKSSLKINGRKVDTSDSDADSYVVNVRRLRKGRASHLTVTGEFTTGNDVVLKATVRRCGR